MNKYLKEDTGFVHSRLRLVINSEESVECTDSKYNYFQGRF